MASIERIYLVGFMGAGKSSVGRALSKKLHWKFVDLDKQIERAEKMKIPDIFSKLGEPRFREVESRELVNASLRQKAVIALGGGAYLNAENRAIAEATGITVWLKADLASIYQRVKIDGSRPLFSDNERAERLYRDRMPFYEMARLHVNTEDSSPEEVAAEIIGKMEKLK